MPTSSSSSLFTQIETTLFQASYILPALLSVTCFTIVLGTLVFIIKFEIPQKHERVALKTVFTLSNALLLLLWLSSSAFFAIESRRHYTMGGFDDLSIPDAVTLSILEASFLWFSFIRSESILKRQAAPALFRVYRAALYIVPLFCLLPIVEYIVFIFFLGHERRRNEALNGIAKGTGPVFTFVMDIFQGVCFLNHVRKIRMDVSEESHQDASLDIIARYGLRSSVACFFQVLAYWTAKGFKILWMERKEGVTLVPYYMARCVEALGLFGKAFALSMMKVALFGQRRKDASTFSTLQQVYTTGHVATTKVAEA